MSSPDGPSPTAAMKLRTLQALRGVAVLLVVIAHISASYGVEDRYIAGPRLTRWMHLPATLAVDLFFVISGVVITLTARPTSSTSGAWRQFLYRRVTRIYPLYWLVTALILIVLLVRPDLVNAHSSHRPQVVPSFLILPQPGDPLVGVGWTLVYELYFYAIFTCALALGRRRLPWVLGAWAAATVAAHLLLAPTHQPYLVVATNLMNLEFVFGVAVAYRLTRRPTTRPWWLMGGAGAALVGVLGYLTATRATSFSSPWFQVFALGVMIAVLLYAVTALDLAGRVRAPRGLVRVGDASYSIYLWHIPILTTCGLILATVPLRSRIAHILLLLLVSVVPVGAGIWLYDRLERPMLRFFHTRMFDTPVAADRRAVIPASTRSSTRGAAAAPERPTAAHGGRS